MTERRAFALGWLISSAALMVLEAAVAADSATGPSASINEIAVGIEKYIADQSAASGGYFKLEHNREELSLQLVRVHLEYLADLGGGICFACVDLVGLDGPVYDVDFFMKGPPGAMTVTETSVHKVNGQPLYAWEQKRSGAWRKVPVKKASRRLLGVINGTDKFEFVYRVRLPIITGDARLWLPLATSDTFQRVEVKSITAPGRWLELDEREHGNKVLFVQAAPRTWPAPGHSTITSSNDCATPNTVPAGAAATPSTPATPAPAIAPIFTLTSSRWREPSASPPASPSAQPSRPSAMTAALTDTTVGRNSSRTESGCRWMSAKPTRIRV